MKKVAKLFGLYLVLSSGSYALAQPIVIERDGIEIDRVNSGDNVSINVGTISTDVLLRIYDDTSGTPASNIGKITISGSLAPSSNARLHVLIAHESQHGFPFDPTLLLPTGAVDVGGNATGGTW